MAMLDEDEDELFDAVDEDTGGGDGLPDADAPSLLVACPFKYKSFCHIIGLKLLLPLLVPPLLVAVVELALAFGYVATLTRLEPMAGLGN